MSPNVSSATYCEARRQNNVNDGGRPADHVGVDLNIKAGPMPVKHSQEMPVGYYPIAGMTMYGMFTLNLK